MQRLCCVTETRVHTHAREETCNNFGNKKQIVAIVITGKEETVATPGLWIVASMTGQEGDEASRQLHHKVINLA
jgi:hypothetical protein